MPKIPDVLLQKLMDMPDNFVDEACKKMGITDTLEFQLYMDAPFVINKSSKNYLRKVLSSSDTAKIQAIYSEIELGLMLGGCVPYIGIIVNIVDACFCFALGNMFGCFIAIISCFPIPGFKVIGKGLDVIITDLLKKISPTEIAQISKELTKRLQKYYGTIWYKNADVKNGLTTITIELKEIAKRLPNLFAQECMNISLIVDNISTTIHKSIQKNISNTYSVSGKQIRLLRLTERGVNY